MIRQIAIGCDHAGYEYKEALKNKLESSGFEVKDYGTYDKESTDYPDFAHPVAVEVERGSSTGILICGSANGVAMAANKHQGVRAAICWNEDLAALARQHNDANVICLPAKFISLDLAEKIMDRFLAEQFEGGRHARRVNKISC